MERLLSFIIFALLIISSEFYGQESSSLDLIANTIELEFSNVTIFPPITDTMNNSNMQLSNVILFDAIIENNAPLVVELIKKQIDINARDNSYRTPIMYTTDDSIEIADLLISHGAYINTRDNYGNTLLMIASERGHKKLVKYLIENHNTLINANNREGLSALHFAIQNGHTEIVELLIYNRANIYNPMPDGLSPIFEATKKGFTRIVNILLKEGVNPNAKIPKTGTSLLGIASAYGSLSMVQTLVTYGANLNTPNKLGIPPIFLAVAKGHSEIVEYLLQQDENITMKTETGISIEDVVSVHDRKTKKIIKKYKK